MEHVVAEGLMKIEELETRVAALEKRLAEVPVAITGSIGHMPPHLGWAGTWTPSTTTCGNLPSEAPNTYTW